MSDNTRITDKAFTIMYVVIIRGGLRHRGMLSMGIGDVGYGLEPRTRRTRNYTLRCQQQTQKVPFLS
jgi:hypothetical protein